MSKLREYDPRVPVRVAWAAYREGKSIHELADMSDKDLLRISNFGRASLHWLRQHTGTAQFVPVDD